MTAVLRPSRKSTDASRATGLSGFLHWWARELAWLIPEALKERGLPASQLIWLHLASDVAIFQRFRAGKPHEVARVDLRDDDPVAEKIAFDKVIAKLGRQPVGIAVRADQVLRKALTLPLAARGNIDQVVRFEMDRQTPYTADQVFFQLGKEHVERASLSLQLAVLPKHGVERTLARVRAWGLELHGIAILDELDGRRGYLNFLPKALRPVTGRFWPWIYAGLATLTVALVAALLLVPVWQKHQLAMALMPMVGQAEREAKSVSALKENLSTLLGQHNHLIEKRLTTTPTVAILEELTKLLPDNTWAQLVEIRGHEVMVQGETGSSSRLVSLFARSRLLGEANHKSPLVKIQNDLERFQLAIAVQPVTVVDAVAAAVALSKAKPGKPSAGVGSPVGRTQ